MHGINVYLLNSMQLEFVYINKKSNACVKWRTFFFFFFVKYERSNYNTIIAVQSRPKSSNGHESTFVLFSSLHFGSSKYTDVIEAEQRSLLNRNHSVVNLSRRNCIQFDSTEKYENKWGEFFWTVSHTHSLVQILQLLSGGIERFSKLRQ